MTIDPNKPVLGNDPDRPRPSRDRGPAGWLWVGIIIVIIFVFWWTVGGPTHRQNALANPAPGAQPDQQNGDPVTDPAQLTSKDAGDLVGRPVQFARATVNAPANGGAFLIDANGTPVLVVKANAANDNHPGAAMRTGAFQRGDVVTIQGTMRKMPSEHDAMVEFNLSTDTAARASHSKVFIEATQVETAAK